MRNSRACFPEEGWQKRLKNTEGSLTNRYYMTFWYLELFIFQQSINKWSFL